MPYYGLETVRRWWFLSIPHEPASRAKWRGFPKHIAEFFGLIGLPLKSMAKLTSITDIIARKKTLISYMRRIINTSVALTLGVASLETKLSPRSSATKHWMEFGTLIFYTTHSWRSWKMPLFLRWNKMVGQLISRLWLIAQQIGVFPRSMD